MLNFPGSLHAAPLGYNANVTAFDGTRRYLGCAGSTSTNFSPSALVWDGCAAGTSTCRRPQSARGCMDASARRRLLSTTDYTVTFASNFSCAADADSGLVDEMVSCMDSNARSSFDATTTEGSCEYPTFGCTVLGGGGADTPRNESLRYFAAAWNAVLGDMRSADLLSNSELSLLVFNAWEGVTFSRCTYLPVFCTAGKLTEAFNTARVLLAQGEYQSMGKRRSLERQLHAEVGQDTEAREAVVEFCELCTWMVQGLLGSRHEAAVSSIIKALHGYVANGQLLDGLSLANLPKLAASTVDLAKAVLAVKLAPPPADDATAEPKLDEGTNVGKVTDKLRNVLDALKAVMSHASKTQVHAHPTISATGAPEHGDDSRPCGQPTHPHPHMATTHP